MTARAIQASQQDDDSKEIALVRQDINYIQRDMAEIKSEIRDFKTFFPTKDQLLADLQKRDDTLRALDVRLAALEKAYKDDREATAERNKYYFRAITTAVIGNIITILVGAFFAIKFFGGK